MKNILDYPVQYRNDRKNIFDIIFQVLDQVKKTFLREKLNWVRCKKSYTLVCKRCLQLEYNGFLENISYWFAFISSRIFTAVSTFSTFRITTDLFFFTSRNLQSRGYF